MEAKVGWAVKSKVAFACHALGGTRGCSKDPFSEGLQGSLLLGPTQLVSRGKGALVPEHGSCPPTGAQSWPHLCGGAGAKCQGQTARCPISN